MNPETPKSSPKKSRSWIWLILLLMVAAGAVYFYRGGTQATAKGPDTTKKSGKGGGAVPVVASLTRRGDMPVYLTGLGSITAFNTVTVRTRVDGEIIKIYFTEGQYVKQGDPLIEIDPRPFQVMLEQAEAGLAGHQAQLANARVDLERYKNLLAQDAVPKQQFDTQEALVNQIG